MLLGERPGFSPQIGVLVDMMHYARLTTLEAVEGLSLEELEAIPDGFSNSIGILLAHIAATDRLYQRLSFNDDGFNEAEWEQYGGAFSMGREGNRVRDCSLEILLGDLEAVRSKTLDEFALRDDTWPSSRLKAPRCENMNQHCAWFHVMEDELSHRGQIRILRKALKS